MEYGYDGRVRRHRRKGCFYLAATLTTLMSLANVSLNINSAARLDLAGKSDFAVLLYVLVSACGLDAKLILSAI